MAAGGAVYKPSTTQCPPTVPTNGAHASGHQYERSVPLPVRFELDHVHAAEAPRLPRRAARAVDELRRRVDLDGGAQARRAGERGVPALPREAAHGGHARRVAHLEDLVLPAEAALLPAGHRRAARILQL
eukprot:scaffold36009_cov60-Phaeocystis_antarctica.AAC.4